MAATSCYISVKFISTLINVGLPAHTVFAAALQNEYEVSFWREKQRKRIISPSGVCSNFDVANEGIEDNIYTD